MAVTAELDEVEQEFVEWHATPTKMRVPSTFKELCKSLHISQATGYRWLKRPNIEAAIYNLVKEAVGGPDRVRAVVDAMFNVSQSQDKDRVQASMLFMRYAGVLNDKPPVDVKSDLEMKSDEELAKMVEDIQVRRAAKVLAAK